MYREDDSEYAARILSYAAILNAIVLTVVIVAVVAMAVGSY